MTSIQLTTNPGLEALAYEELVERAVREGIPPEALRREPDPLRGRLEVFADAPESRLIAAASGLRSVHHVLRPWARFELEEGRELERIAETVEALRVPAIHSGTPFRITTRRSGTHEFTSIDVQRAAGAAVVRATGARVDLFHHDVNLRVDVVDRRALVAEQLTREPLSLRHRRAYRQRITLRPNIAWAMLRLAGCLGRDASVHRLLDPCCGTGTILLEAGSLRDDLELWGSDRNPEAVEGTRENLQHAGCGDRSRVRTVDLRELADHWPRHRVDRIVTNPPFGMRLGRGMNLFGFYTCLLRESGRVLAPGGRVSVLAHKRGVFQRAAERLGYRVLSTHVVEVGGLFPAILIAEPGPTRPGRERGVQAHAAESTPAGSPTAEDSDGGSTDAKSSDAGSAAEPVAAPGVVPASSMGDTLTRVRVGTTDAMPKAAAMGDTSAKSEPSERESWR